MATVYYQILHLQDTREHSLWIILRRKGIQKKPETPKPKTPEKPGLFSMFD